MFEWLKKFTVGPSMIAVVVLIVVCAILVYFFWKKTSIIDSSIDNLNKRQATLQKQITHGVVLDDNSKIDLKYHIDSKDDSSQLSDEPPHIIKSTDYKDDEQCATQREDQLKEPCTPHRNDQSKEPLEMNYGNDLLDQKLCQLENEHLKHGSDEPVHNYYEEDIVNLQRMKSVKDHRFVQRALPELIIDNTDDGELESDNDFEDISFTEDADEENMYSVPIHNGSPVHVAPAHETLGSEEVSPQVDPTPANNVEKCYKKPTIVIQKPVINVTPKVPVISNVFTQKKTPTFITKKDSSADLTKKILADINNIDINNNDEEAKLLLDQAAVPETKKVLKLSNINKKSHFQKK